MARIRAAFHDPDGDRYGLPPTGGAAPRTATPPAANSARRLCPGRQPIAAQVLWSGVGGTRTAYLYRLDLARPKRTATPASARGPG
jgi:hypothetical protein